MRLQSNNRLMDKDRSPCIHSVNEGLLQEGSGKSGEEPEVFCRLMDGVNPMLQVQ